MTDCQDTPRLIKPKPFSKFKILKTRPSNITPTSDPHTEPIPPVRSVPPTTTAAMAVSSQPTASFGDPVKVCPANNALARPASTTLIAHTHSLILSTDRPI